VNPSPPLRGLLVALAAFAVLAALAGPALLRPARNNHFTHLARGWLDGRLELAGDPPGYPRAHDDWGRVWTLTLADGSSLRGDPCRTAACEQLRKQGIETWRPTTGGSVELRRGDIVRRDSRWYVTFPPGPALVMLPFVALWGLGFLDVLFTALAAALIPALLVRLLERVHGPGHLREHLWAAAAWTLASPACFVGAHGSVWFTAQILGALFLVLHLDAAWDARQPARAGLWLGLAVACRISIAFALPFFLLEWWRDDRRVGTLLRFLAPLAVIGLTMAALNWLRFDDPLEFGHRYLDIRWQSRIQTFGMFSPVYLWRNVQCMLWLAPQLVTGAPWLRWSIHGMGLLLGSPWLLLLLRARQRFPQRLGLWLATLAVMTPALLYQNSGQRQFSYRFALDFLPMLLLLLVVGNGARGRWFPALVIASAILQLHGAWWFDRDPARLFVADPWWPFAPE
jgi:hypothetical protein